MGRQKDVTARYVGRQTDYGYSYDFYDGRRVSYQVFQDGLEILFTKNGKPLPGYPKVGTREDLRELLSTLESEEMHFSEQLKTRLAPLLQEVEQEAGEKVTKLFSGVELDTTDMVRLRELAAELLRTLGAGGVELPACLEQQLANPIPRPAPTTSKKEASARGDGCTIVNPYWRPVAPSA